MSGGKLPSSRQVPLFDSHPWRFKQPQVVDVLGSARELRFEKDIMVGRVHFSRVGEAENAWTKTKEGHVTDYSLGYKVVKAQWVPEGEKAIIQGRTFIGPVKVALQWVPREVSITPIGADEQAKARSQSLNATATPKEEKVMDQKLREFLEGRGLAKDATEEQAWQFLARLELPDAGRSDPPKTPAPSAPTPDLDQARAEAARIEQVRVLEIQATAQKFSFDESRAMDLIKEGKSIDQARKLIMDDYLERRGKDAQGNAGFRAPVEMGADERDKFRAAAGDALLMRCAVRTIKIDKPAPGAQDLTGFSMVELARHGLLLAGQSPRGVPMDMLGRALTTSDFPYILADVAHKSLNAGFEAAEETWPIWCGTGQVSDFKTHNAPRAGETDDLDEIGEHEEYKYGSRAEAREQYQIVTYGKLFKISRQTIINDDLNALTDVPAQHGQAAARKIGDIAYAVLIANSAMGDGKALFHVDHLNLAGTGGAPGIATLGAAVQAMKLQKDIGGKRRLNIRPVFFIGPVAMETLCEQLFKSNLEGTQAKPNLINPYSGAYFTRVYEPRLDDSSSAVWYLAAQIGRTIKVFFLNGVQQPYLETKQGWNVDGVEYKVRIDAGAKAMDWRGLYKNPGA
jgi:hypothetical protein